MIDISLNLYRIFYIAANSKTILEASEKLYISQPAVSKSIKKLEDLLGVKLFHRTKNGIVLTNDGKIFFEYVDKSYNYLLAGQRIIENFKQLKNGDITIGVPSHIACFFVLDYLKKFIKLYPNIRIKLVSDSTDTLTSKLYNHKLDFIIDSPPIDISDEMVVIKKIGDFDTTFICSNSFNEKNLDIKNFRNCNYILPNKNSPMYNFLTKTLNSYNINIEPTLEVDTTDIIISSVKKDLGIGYVVKAAIKEELRSGQIIEIKTPFELPKLQINLVYMKNYVTSASKELMNFLESDI